MPSPLLTFFKYLFLVVLYLFFVRVLRAVWVEIREPKSADLAAHLAADAPPPPPFAAPVPVGVGATAGWASPPLPASPERLVVEKPPERQGQAFDLGAELTVGRAQGCGVSLPEDTFISQLHARVFRRDGRLWVEDLGSTNGTLLNQQPVTAAVPLNLGDRLQVGRTVLVLEATR